MSAAKKRTTKLNRRYGHMAPMRNAHVDLSLHGATWLGRYAEGPDQDLCLYKILVEALKARFAAVHTSGAQAKRPFKTADIKMERIANDRVSTADGRRDEALEALRKYVLARGGGKREAEAAAREAKDYE
jgi:hypothetical protein